MDNTDFEYRSIEELQQHCNVGNYLSVNEFILEIPYLFDVEIKVVYDKERDMRMFDLNTGAKSEVRIPVDSDRCNCITAYIRNNNGNYKIDDMSDILYMILHCMHRKPYVNEKWKKALLHYGLIKIEMKEELVFLE